MRKLLYILAFLIPFIGFAQEPVMHLNFVTGSMLDESGNGNDATNHGAEFKLTEKGMALRFDGSNYAVIDEYTIEKENASIFISFYKKDIIGKRYFLAHNSTHAYKCIGFYNNILRAEGLINSDFWCNYSFPLKINHWYYLTIIANNGVVTTYLNNILIDTKTPSTNIIINRIGGWINCYNNGDISDIQIYDVAVNSDKRTSLYQKFLVSRSPFPAKRHFAHLKPTELTEDGLVLYTNCEPVDGQLVDGSGNNNDGTITNCVSTKDGLRSYGANMNSKVVFSPAILDDATTWTVVTKFRDYEKIGSYDFYIGGGRYKALMLSHTDKVGFRESDGDFHYWDGTGNTTDAPSSTIENKEMNLVWIADETNINLYINGIDFGYITPTITQIYISKLFEGYIDAIATPVLTLQEVLIYNTAKTHEFAINYHNSWADDIQISEDFSYGADEIVKKLPNWSHNATADVFIGEKADGTFYMEWDNNGTAIFFENLDGLVDNGWVKSFDYYNGSAWSDESGVTVSALSTAEAWFDYSDKKLTFTGIAGMRIAKIIIQKGQPR